jgi:hypothetical protein
MVKHIKRSICVPEEDIVVLAQIKTMIECKCMYIQHDLFKCIYYIPFPWRMVFIFSVNINST